METADGIGPAPPELRLAWWCDQGRLPEAGGVLDQNYALMYRMRTVENVYRVVARFRHLKGAQIHNLNTPERRILRALKDEGLL